jgi:hypothetical protein
MKDVCRKAKSEQREKLIADLQVLYENDTLPAERWLRHLVDTYQQIILMPLLNAWHQLKWYWKLPSMPLTNNSSEHLYANLWSREKKRNKRTHIRKTAWLTEARWRHNQKPVQRKKSPFEAFHNLPSKASSLSSLYPIFPKPHTNFT